MQRRRTVGTCGVADCDRATRSSRYCSGHYQRQRRGDPNWDSPLRPYNPGATCSWPDCTRRTHAHGLCNNHYQIYVRRQQVSADDWQRMFVAQAGLCAICRQPGEARLPGYPSLYVDHDHGTGQVRGLLCSKCNTGLGLLGDTAEALAAALAYLS